MSIMRRLRRGNPMAIGGATWFAAVLAGLFASSAFAQWESQTVPLKPGWNAVFIEVDPVPSACDEVFAGIPVKSVWAWNERIPGPQYLRDPGTLTPDQPEWLSYFPADRPEAFLTDLFALRGGVAYLIHFGGNEPMDFRIEGKPTIRAPRWTADAYNLAGFPVDPESPPTFSAFFAASKSLVDQPVFRLDPSGHWNRIEAPDTAAIVRGEAYWVHCAGETDFEAPLAVRVEGSQGLSFGRGRSEIPLQLINAAGTAQEVILNVRPSEAAPEKAVAAKNAPFVAGEALLSYFATFQEGELVAWKPLNGPLAVTVAAHDTLYLQLAVRRAEMTPVALPPDGGEIVYASLLEVTGGAGVFYRLPVTAKGLASKSDPAKSAKAYPNDIEAGLWVGNAYVNQVSRAGSTEDLLSTSSKFPLRLIVHVDAVGQANLLQQVYEMTRPPSGEGEGEGETDYVLLTKDELLADYAGTSVRDDHIVGRRISSSGFAFPRTPDPQDPDGPGTWVDQIAMARAETALTCDVVLPYDDPLNPFFHRYHPDHNNLDELYNEAEKYGDGIESYTFVRRVTLEFAGTDPNLPDGATNPAWGDTEIGGTYRETFLGYVDGQATDTYGGFNSNPIQVQGSFRLKKISDVDQLNDGKN